MKYKIREENILYSKVKAKERRNRIQTIENRLKICEEKIAESPTQENLANLESAKTEYEKRVRLHRKRLNHPVPRYMVWTRRKKQ